MPSNMLNLLICICCLGRVLLKCNKYPPFKNKNTKISIGIPIIFRLFHYSIEEDMFGMFVNNNIINIPNRTGPW